MGCSIRLSKLKQTTSFCPTQWEGTLDDGRRFYARFRFGVLSAEVGRRPEIVYEEQVSHSLDGEMETETMLAYLGAVYVHREHVGG